MTFFQYKLLNKSKLGLLLLFTSFCNSTFYSQSLKAGFDANELSQVMTVSVRTGAYKNYFSDSNYVDAPIDYSFDYRSKDKGFKNVWELWLGKNNTAIISIRGTTPHSKSWLANVYAAMSPAKGKIVLNQKDTFQYQLSSHPQAAVHSGWLLCMAYLAPDIVAKIDSCYMIGIKEFILTGHSQGGAIAYLLTTYLNDLKLNGTLHRDVQFKTYCTAAPKPGNLYYAYTFEAQTQNGWGFNVVNPLDWVPELPFSNQSINDINPDSPLSNMDELLKKEKLFKRLIYKKLKKKITKNSLKSEKKYRKYLGEIVGKEVQNSIGNIQMEPFYPSFDYVRTGQTILLEINENYKEKYKYNPNNFMLNHFHHPYIFLLNPSLLIP